MEMLPVRTRFGFMPETDAQPTARQRGRLFSAFTFVELLAVIGIVFVLASLLLALGAAMRKNARRQACLIEFEHVKNAQAIYFSKRGALVDETLAATWHVRVAGGAPRPLTSMEYFAFTIRQGCADAYTHLQMLGDTLAPSTELNGPVVGGYRCYGTVRIYATLADAMADAGSHTNCLYTLYDPLNAPEINAAGLAVGNLAQSNTGPLMTLIDPWDKDQWDPSTFYSTVAGGVTFKWRKHELDYRNLTALYDNSRALPQYMWYTDDSKVPPYLPFSEGMLVSSPGPDGLWGALNASSTQTVAPHGLANRGIPVGQKPKPPFDIQSGTLDDNAKDNLYSSERMQ